MLLTACGPKLPGSNPSHCLTDERLTFY